MKSSKPEKPISAYAQLVKDRAERTAARQARQAAEAERIYLRDEKRRLKREAQAGRDARRKDRLERRLNESGRRAYLDERADLRQYNPEELFNREQELFILARGRAQYLREIARQAQVLSAVDDPESLEDAQRALNLALQAEAEAESQRGIMRRRKRLWEAAQKATQTL